jgi:hypothetical protein
MFNHEYEEPSKTWLVVMRYPHQEHGQIIKANLSESMAKHYASRCSCHEWVIEAVPANKVYS